MTIPAVSANGTNQVWLNRTNQVITVINALTDGALTLNGSITFSNSTFSLALPSLNVNNSIVVTGASGNTLSLQSSNAVVNGTVYIKGSGNALYVSNNAIITGNLSVNTNMTVGGTLFANNEIVGNANVQLQGVDGQLRAVQGNFGVILRNDGNSFYILQTGSVANAVSAGFNSMQPLTWNLSTGILTLDASRNGTVIGGNVIITGANTSLNVSNNVVVQGNMNVTGPLVTITNTANVQGQLTTGGLHYANGGLQMSNTAITFDKPGTTFIQYNQADFNGNGALQLSGNIQVNGQMVVTGTAIFTNTVIFNTATDASLAVTNSATIGNNITVVNKVTAGNGVFSDLHGQGRIISEGEIVAKLGTAGQFRAVSGSTGAIFRNDGTNFFLLSTGSVAQPDTTTWNPVLLPFSFNLTSGIVSIDQGGVGVNIGGSITLGTVQSITQGVTLSSNSLILPNIGALFGKDSGGTPRAMMQYDNGNSVDVFTGVGGTFRVLNSAGSTQLAAFDNLGDLRINGTFTLIGGINAGSSIVIPNNIYYYGQDTGGIARPLIGTDAGNQTNLWCTSGGIRILKNDGSTAFFSIDNLGKAGFFGSTIATFGSLSVGGSPINTIVGSVAANFGYAARSGTAGGFRTNHFNIDWSGTATGIYIDNSLVAFFPTGTNTSDRRLKTQIETATNNALEQIRQLRTVTYRLKNTELCKNLEETKQIGYIADELEQIIPEAVIGHKDGMLDDGKISPQGLNTTTILSIATKAISELANHYEALEARIKAIEERLNTTI